MAELRVIKKRIEDIKPYEQNPRRNDKAVDAVWESIKKFGYRNPIIINGEGVLLAGHTRLRALKKTNIEEVECIQVDHLSAEGEKAFRIADNRVADFADWNGDLLDAEMSEIDADDWEKFGFKPKELNRKDRERVCRCPRCGAMFEK